MAPPALILLVATASGCSDGCSRQFRAVDEAYVHAANRQVNLNLFDAFVHHDHDRARKHLAEGADLNFQLRGRGDVTILMIVSSVGALDSVKFLLDNGADPNIQADDGRTALMRAAVNGKLDVVTMLIDHGADSNFENEDGHTALFMARRKGHTAVVTLLEESLAR